MKAQHKKWAYIHASGGIQTHDPSDRGDKVRTHFKLSVAWCLIDQRIRLHGSILG